MSRPLSFWVCVFVYVLCLVQVLAATDILTASVSPALSLPHRGRNQTDNTSLHPRDGNQTGIISVPPTRTGLLAQHESSTHNVAPYYPVLGVPTRGRNRTGRISLQPTRDGNQTGIFSVPHTKTGLLAQRDSYTHNVAPYPVLGVPTRGRNRTGRISLQPTRAGLLAQADNYASNSSKTAVFIESIVNISKHGDTSRPIDNTLVLMLAEIIGAVLGVAARPNTSADAPDDSTHVPSTPKTTAYEPLPHFRHARRQRSATPLDADQMQIHTVSRPSQHKGHTTHTQAPRWKQQMLDQ
jgi:hypothetical protein